MLGVSASRDGDLVRALSPTERAGEGGEGQQGGRGRGGAAGREREGRGERRGAESGEGWWERDWGGTEEGDRHEHGCAAEEQTEEGFERPISRVVKGHDGWRRDRRKGDQGQERRGGWRWHGWWHEGGTRVGGRRGRRWDVARPERLDARCADDGQDNHVEPQDRQPQVEGTEEGQGGLAARDAP